MCLPLFSQARDYEYDEIVDPVMRTAMESMRAHQVQYTMFLFYTINVDTPGYIEVGGYNRRGKDGKIEMLPFYRWRAGPVVETGKDLDIYIDANSRGFFAVLFPNGSTSYTRDGRLRLDGSNRLVTLQGSYPVLNTEGGTIVIEPGTDVTISRTGMVYSDGDPAGKIKVVVFSNAGLDKLVAINGSFFFSGDGEEPEVLDGGELNYSVFQGHLEENNVLKAIVGDVGMLKRSYDGIAKAARVVNRAMGTVIAVANP